MTVKIQDSRYLEKSRKQSPKCYVISAQKTRQSNQKVISSYKLENLRNKYFKILSELVVSSMDELDGESIKLDDHGCRRSPA